MLRKTVFWLHLIAGTICGLVIVTMAFTGLTQAFAKELIAWSESDARRVALAAPEAPRLALDDILRRTHEEYPDKKPTAITIFADPAAAVAITFGRDSVYYVNPYTGEIRPPASHRVSDFIHQMERIHRFLGLTEKPTKPIGEAITHTANSMFLFMVLSGLFLWWPRRWTWRSFKAVALINLRLGGKSRDFNWHNATGFWIMPLLLMTTLTALPMSYRWANDLLYRMTGSEPPAQIQGEKARPGNSGPPESAQKPDAKTNIPAYGTMLANLQGEYPNWDEMTFRLPDGGRARGNQPGNVTLRTNDQWPLFSDTALTVDPATGAVLGKETFAEQNTGRRWRAWARYLHTGEALGLTGKILVSIGACGAILLVWTGFALAGRRFFFKKPTPKSA